jgi:non-heme chloroperoxidase
MTLTNLPVTSKEIQVKTGVALRYVDTGPSDAATVLLLHGYSDSSVSFSPIFKFLSPEVRLLIPDQRGHGESERPAHGYAPDDLARDAIALLDGLGIESACVVGHSLGSFVAQQMALLAPRRVRKLVLVGSAASPATDSVLSLRPAVEALTDPVDEAFVREFQMSAVFRPVPAAIMERAVAESLNLPARVWRAVLAGLVSYRDPARNLGCPIAIAWGDRDGIFGRTDQEQLLHCNPGARLHVFKDVGHTPHWEVPEDFADWLATNVVT